MKNFMDENFLLETKTAEVLFHDYAKQMPIFDYHCHVNVKEIAEDKKYSSITELWLGGDHYKWRAMRLFGIDEKFITGESTDFEKFEAYASMIEYAIGNPLYHWTHLELQRYFGITETLKKANAKEIFDKANAILQGGLSTRKLIKMSNVTKICSTDDPIDNLEWHIMLKNEGYEVEVMPTFRPDKAVNIENADFASYIKLLEEVAKVQIASAGDVLKALEKRLDFFCVVGSKISDHSLPFIPCTVLEKDKIEEIFNKGMAKETLTFEEIQGYKTYILTSLAKMYHDRNVVMQLHMGATRNNNTNMFEKLGADSGFDGIDDNQIAVNLSKFLDKCNQNGLPKTVLYTLNPKDNYVLATMMGNFASSKVATKVQFGSAWWFNDNMDGMKRQMIDFANLGMLSKFIGMLTDSRSFASYARHEYFRRILCNLLGEMVENGEFPQDFEVLGKIVQDISYNNVVKYFE